LGVRLPIVKTFGKGVSKMARTEAAASGRQKKGEGRADPLKRIRKSKKERERASRKEKGEYKLNF